jgi:hypothetical protein
MKGMELREFLCVAQRQKACRPRFEVRGTPPPCFLQEYDSMGVNRRGCAKDVILWELGNRVDRASKWGGKEKDNAPTGSG